MNGGFLLNFLSLSPSTSPAELAQLLGTDYGKIKRLYYRGDRQRHYLAFDIPKKNGGKRRILAPSDKLKTLQSRLAFLLKKIYKPREPVKAFLDGGSIVSNAYPHCRKPYVFNIDLENFFGTITFARIRGMLISKPYSLTPETATVIAHLATINGILPQGAPSSPILSNMLCASLDRDLYSLAKRNRAVYTRYADDITLSFYCPAEFLPPGVVEYSISNGKPNHYYSRAGQELQSLVRQHGFTINFDKVRLQGPGERRTVTGLVTNQKPNVPRPYIRKTAALIHSLEKNGVEAANAIYKQKNPNSSGVLESHLQGRLLFIKQVVGESSVVYRRLAQRYNMLPIRSKVPNAPISTTEDSDNFKVGEFIKTKCWVTEISESIEDDLVQIQGTAFMIQGGLLVTCEHNLSYQTKERRHEYDECLVYRVGEGEGVYEAQVIIRNKYLDLAVLKIKDGPDGLEHFTLEVTKEPNIGDRVAVLGFPNHKTGFHVGILKCRITNKYPLYDVQHSEVDKTLYAGNSGGAVINSSYHVVGVAAKGAEGNPNGKNTFIRVSELIGYLQKSGFDM
ncbi:reverse transcriptase domain-containing protein [Pseudomonas sp. VB3]|uniref:reverse transcriptase domain-containing protein n=1 Tax=Pseudomonas sp. VB3 TaxID=2994641 RepID=UPI0022EC6A6D|nr:reverse transcriptase domain-containing protein [Pseudomonas sp. VB3]